MYDQQSQEIMSGQIEGGGVCPIAVDGDSEGWIVVDVLLISHQRTKERQGIGLKRARHGPSVRGDKRSSRPEGIILYGFRDTPTQRRRFHHGSTSRFHSHMRHRQLR
jgi:hypothetical protein